MKKAISDFADRQGILIEDNFTFGEWEALRIRRGRDLRGFMKAADLVGAGPRGGKAQQGGGQKSFWQHRGFPF